MTGFKAADVRKFVDHPIIDADGHFVELQPMLDDHLLSHLEETGGAELRERYIKGVLKPFDTTALLATRDDPSVRENWKSMSAWWGWQAENTKDRATCHLPKLLYERLDEMGIDFMLCYPSIVLAFLDQDDGTYAGALARGANKWLSKIFKPYEDRIAVGGIVPMTTPQIACAELEYAVKELGMKTIVITGYARRMLGDKPANGPQPYRLDTFGIDSAYDYDPFWKMCVDLGVAPVSHSAHLHHRVGRSVSNYSYNHIGCLGTAHESLAKSLFMGGVTHRFPTLKVGFLEGGVSWACDLYSGLLGHWAKRNAEAIQVLNPENLKVAELMEYVGRYGDSETLANLPKIEAFFKKGSKQPTQLDDFAKAHIRRAEDIRDKFIPNFYFGCEADDPLAAWAFAENINPMGARLRAMIGSDIAHWDVVDMLEPIEEAYEMVEHGKFTTRDFRDYTYLNPIRLHAGMNPNFFKGTVVEKQVAADLAKGLENQ
jgi:predicted TIM-barrel fold metal-dependent hydrolase